MSKLTDLLRKHGFRIEGQEPVGIRQERVSAIKGRFGYMIDWNPNSSLLISVPGDCNWQKAFHQIRPIGTELMGQDAICRYAAKAISQWTYFIEWNLTDADEYLRSLVNRTGVWSQVPVRDLFLYGGRQTADYEDTELQRLSQEATRLHQQYPRVYGRDPAECDLVRLYHATDFGLFLEFTVAKTECFEAVVTYQQHKGGTTSMLGALPGAIVEQMGLQNASLRLDFVIYYICQRLGISTAEPTDKHRLRYDTKTFDKWVDFYEVHLLKICPNDNAIADLATRYFADEDISAFAPTGDWRDA